MSAQIAYPTNRLLGSDLAVFGKITDRRGAQVSLMPYLSQSDSIMSAQHTSHTVILNRVSDDGQ